VPASIREDADLVLDGGELPGIPSTVVDLSRHETGEWEVLRDGAVSAERLARVLD
jgi:L-threonylcarbamoyladenylate synthase